MYQQQYRGICTNNIIGATVPVTILEQFYHSTNNIGAIVPTTLWKHLYQQRYRTNFTTYIIEVFLPITIWKQLYQQHSYPSLYITEYFLIYFLRANQLRFNETTKTHV